MSVEYRLLGPLEVLVDGRSVDVGPPRQRCVLVGGLLTPSHKPSTVPAPCRAGSGVPSWAQ